MAPIPSSAAPDPAGTSAKKRSTQELDVLSAKYAQAIAQRKKMVSSWLPDSDDDEDDEATQPQAPASSVQETTPTATKNTPQPSTSPPDPSEIDSPFMAQFRPHANSTAGLGSARAHQKHSAQVVRSRLGVAPVDSRVLGNAAKTLNGVRKQLLRNRESSSARALAATAPGPAKSSGAGGGAAAAGNEPARRRGAAGGALRASENRDNGDGSGMSDSDSEEEESRGKATISKRNKSASFFDTYRSSKKRK